MTRDRNFWIVSAVVVLLSVGAYVASLHRPEPEEVPQPRKEHLRGILELNRLADTSKALMVGYNYYLLKRYAKDNGQDIDISMTDVNLSYIDSLRDGTVDIVVIPYEDSIAIDSVLMTTPLDSISVWLMKHDDHSTLSDANAWIDAWHHSDEYAPTREKFLRRFNPFRAKQREYISPYDSLMRNYADTVGCDWRMIAAVIYSESHFHVEAKSRRGAIGLMQLMPRNAERYGITDPLDPEQSIRAGALMLQALFKRYAGVGDNYTERFKYALAAYNAGIGRIDDCINYARYRGVDTSYWVNVVNIIPEMSDERVLESGVVKLGTFKGVETVAYVNTVIQIYLQFCRICPD